MTLAASWELEPHGGQRWTESMQVYDADDVDRLLRKLGTPPALDAYLVDLSHADRADSPEVHVAVRQRWVYLRWADADFDGAPDGAPRSPGAHGGYQPEYLAGTGLQMDQAADVLTEWLSTAQRPALVTWLTHGELLSRRDTGADPT